MPELALLGGAKSKRKPFPEWPQFDANERRALMEVLESRVLWRTPGTRTLEFEQAFAEVHGARHGVAVTNGTLTMSGSVNVNNFVLAGGTLAGGNIQLHTAK